MICSGRYFLPLLVISINSERVFINNFLLKQKRIAAFIHSKKYRGKSINRLRSIANIIATKSLYLTPNFGLFFIAEMSINQYFAIKKSSLTNIDQNLKNSLLIENLIKMALQSTGDIENKAIISTCYR